MSMSGGMVLGVATSCGSGSLCTPPEVVKEPIESLHVGEGVDPCANLIDLVVATLANLIDLVC